MSFKTPGIGLGCPRTLGRVGLDKSSFALNWDPDPHHHHHHALNSGFK